MTSRIRRAMLVALPLAAALPLAGTARAQPAPLTIDSLGTMLGNMGYDVKPNASGKSLAIVAHGNFDVTITFSQNTPGGEVLAYIYLQKYTPAQFPRLDLTTLLVSDDSNYSYFSLAHDHDDMLLYVQRSMPAPSVSPQLLRSSIDNLVKVTQTTEQTWNTRLWK